jgi:TIR domain
MAVEDTFVPHGQAKDEPNAALTGGLSSISHAAEGESEEQSTAKVFISYSRKDIAFADRLEAALKARGFEPLIDRTEIYAFEEWWSRIEALIARADTVVFVLSPDSVASEVALKEVEFAASLNKRFAPIVFCSVQEKLVPEALAKLHFIFFDDAARFEQSADQLAAALNTTFPGSDSTPSSLSRHDVGFWQKRRLGYCCARLRWSKQNTGLRRGREVPQRPPKRRARSSGRVGKPLLVKKSGRGVFRVSFTRYLSG